MSPTENRTPMPRPSALLERRPRTRSTWLLLLMISLAIGCRRQETLDVTYGQRRGDAAASVNGTSVLATMFEEAGFDALTWYYLSSRLNNCNVIVWAPDEFAPVVLPVFTIEQL